MFDQRSAPRRLRPWRSLALTITVLAVFSVTGQERTATLPKVRISPDGRGFRAADRDYRPFGLTYFRPGTGWAPQLWKQYDADATRADFARMKELGVNCVRVFLSYGSFLTETNALAPEGVAKFDQFLAMAEQAGVYVHPTGPDHWEGTPGWARADRIADEQVLTALENFWSLFAARYRGRNVIFAYDLRNEPEVGWDSPALRRKWNDWLDRKYSAPANVARSWGQPDRELQPGAIPVPEAKDRPGNPELLDYQRFREDVADDWTRRQVNAIKRADPNALVTVGLIQWSIPVLLPRVAHYSGFHPARQARYLDFLEVHFYPLEHGFYEYANAQDELRNLAYLDCVVRETARPGKPVVIGEFGWYGGGKPTIDGGRHPAASEEQQARWCRRAIETTQSHAVGWLNWGFYDHPEARDVTQFTGLLTADGRLKAWGQEFARLAQRPLGPWPLPRVSVSALDWEACLTSTAAANQVREEYIKRFAPSE